MKLCLLLMCLSLTRFFSWLAVIAAVSVCGPFSPAAAQSCSFSITNEAFGSLDVTTNAVVDTTATVSISCSSLLPVRVCINLGAGGGGASSAASRFMQSGTNTLSYGLYTDAARTTPWGSNLWSGGGANSVDVTFGIGGGSTTLTIYGRIFAGQQTVPPGPYLSAFSGQDASINYGLLSFLLNCGILATIQTAAFNVTATVIKNCSVSTTPVNFGSVGVLISNLTATGTVSVQCTNTTPYTIGLNAGTAPGATITNRKMTNGTSTVGYALYSNSARTTNWGDTAGIDTVSGTGSGYSQSYSVYGSVPAQPTPAPGTYTDTITVTVTY